MRPRSLAVLWKKNTPVLPVSAQLVQEIPKVRMLDENWKSNEPVDSSVDEVMAMDVDDSGPRATSAEPLMVQVDDASCTDTSLMLIAPPFARASRCPVAVPVLLSMTIPKVEMGPDIATAPPLPAVTSPETDEIVIDELDAPVRPETTRAPPRDVKAVLDPEITTLDCDMPPTIEITGFTEFCVRVSEFVNAMVEVARLPVTRRLGRS